MNALQTRACILPKGALGREEDLKTVLQQYADRGYNTLIIPAFHEGSIYFRVSSYGNLKKGFCPGKETIKLLAEFQFTIWLLVDPLSAGSPDENEFGNVARWNREWLMKNHQGSYSIPANSDMPGLFCWTSLQFRRYLGNFLVELLDAFPIDGIIFDVRRYPLTTENPETWSHLGYSCLRRLQGELDIDLEEFLTEPSRDLFWAVMEWRHREFEHFLLSLKARTQNSHYQLFTGLLGAFNDRPPSDYPWVRCYTDGLAGELFLQSRPSRFADDLRKLDQLSKEPLPAVAVIEDETEIHQYKELLQSLPITGICVLDTDSDEPPEFPDPGIQWEKDGALETSPRIASLTVLENLIKDLDPADPHTLFFNELEDYLEDDYEKMTFENLMKIREDVRVIHKQILEGSSDSDLRYRILRELELVMRLLALSPASPIEY